MEMRRIESMEDHMRDVVTYEFGNGQRLCVAGRAVRKMGIVAIVREQGLGHLLPTDRLPVIHHGEMVGMLPPEFDPFSVRSTSFLYEPRAADFTRDGDRWIANRTLGPSDVAAVEGFRPA